MTTIKNQVLFEKKWQHFIDEASRIGRVSYETSGMTGEDLGTVVRYLRMSHLTNNASYPQLWISAAFAYALRLKEGEVLTHIMALLSLHSRRETLFDYILVAEFGIHPRMLMGVDYLLLRQHFNEWLDTIEPSVLSLKHAT